MSTQWLYKVVDLKPKSAFAVLNAEDMQEALNQHGAQGWELVDVVQLAVNHASLYFKKPK